MTIATKAKKTASRLRKKSSRCWPGYEPVPGKKPHEQGSCRKKAAAKTTPSERGFRRRRRAQLDAWQKKHPHARRSAAQHLHEPGRRTRKPTNVRRTRSPRRRARTSSRARRHTS